MTYLTRFRCTIAPARAAIEAQRAPRTTGFARAVGDRSLFRNMNRLSASREAVSMPQRTTGFGQAAGVSPLVLNPWVE